VYDHRPTDNQCLACGVPTEPAAEGYAFTIEFPVTETPDGPTAELSGEFCADCASRIGTKVLLGGVHGERERHERLMQALIERDHPMEGESVDSMAERTTDEAR
jgi:hypothetical protein